MEKVLLAEIRKRESQLRATEENVGGIHEQLRVALSSVQEALGTLKYRIGQEREEVLQQARANFKHFCLLSDTTF